MPEFIRTIKQLAEIAPLGEWAIYRKLKKESDAGKEYAMICNVRIDFVRSTDDKNASYFISDKSYTEFGNKILRK